MANQIDNDSKILGGRVEGYTGGQTIVRVTGGRIYTTHINDVGELEVHYSDNDGVNWTLDETFSYFAVEIDMSCLVVYSDTDIVLAYCFATGSNIYTIKVQLRNHTTGIWNEIYEATSLASNYIIKPSITINKYLTSRLHLMYITHNGTSADVRHDKTDDKGSSWAGVTTKNITSGGIAAQLFRNYSLDSDSSSGDLYFWFDNTLSSNISIYRLDSSGTYLSLITESSSVFQGTCGVVTSGNKKWLVGLVYGYLRIGYTTATSGGITSSLNISSIGALAGNICCGLDNNDNLYVIYTKSADERAYIRKYDNDTATWSAESTLTTGDGLRPSCEQRTLPGTSFIHYIFYSD